MKDTNNDYDSFFEESFKSEPEEKEQFEKLLTTKKKIIKKNDKTMDFLSINTSIIPSDKLSIADKKRTASLEAPTKI